MKITIEKLSSRPFVRNVFVVASGTALAQIIYMILSPLITRIYGPENYGLMGTFMAIVMIIGPVAALTFPIAVVLPKKDEEARSLITLSLMISIGSAGFLAVFLFSFHGRIVELFGLQEISSLLYLLPLVALFSGLMQTAESWLIRTQQFKVTAKVDVLHALILQGSMVIIGVIYPAASILIILSAFAIGLKATLMIWFSHSIGIRQMLTLPSNPSALKKIALKHKNFPLYRAPEVLIDAISYSLPLLLLVNFFGPASAGFYSIGIMVLTIPAKLIGKSVGNVFYPKISEAANKGENLTELIKKTTFYMGIIGVLPYIIVIAFGPWLFSFVFGSEWGTAGEYARWIALWTFFSYLNQPSVSALPAMSAQAFQLISTIILLIARIVALTIGFYIFNSDLIAVALFSITGGILNLVFILFTLHISKLHDSKISNPN